MLALKVHCYFDLLEEMEKKIGLVSKQNCQRLKNIKSVHSCILKLSIKCVDEHPLLNVLDQTTLSSQHCPEK